MFLLVSVLNHREKNPQAVLDKRSDCVSAAFPQHLEISVLSADHLRLGKGRGAAAAALSICRNRALLLPGGSGGQSQPHSQNRDLVVVVVFWD